MSIYMYWAYLVSENGYAVYGEDYEPCLNSWEYISSSGSCYMLYDNGEKKVGWDEAKSLCESLNFTNDEGQNIIPTLAAVYFPEEISEIDSVYAHYYDTPWFGGHYIKKGILSLYQLSSLI